MNGWDRGRDLLKLNTYNDHMDNTEHSRWPTFKMADIQDGGDSRWCEKKPKTRQTDRHSINLSKIRTKTLRITGYIHQY